MESQNRNRKSKTTGKLRRKGGACGQTQFKSCCLYTQRNDENCSIPVLIVDLVSKAWCVNDCQFHSHSLLLDVCTQGHTHTVSQCQHTIMPKTPCPLYKQPLNAARFCNCTACFLHKIYSETDLTGQVLINLRTFSKQLPNMKLGRFCEAKNIQYIQRSFRP